MVTGLETLGHQIDNASAARGQQTEAASVAARDAYNVGSHQAVAGRAEAMNAQLEQSGLIPGLHIDGIIDQNTVRVKNDAGGTVNASVEGDSLRYTRPGQNGSETVNIDLTNGREMVTKADGTMDIRGVRGAQEVIHVGKPAENGDRTVTMPGTDGRQYTMGANGQIRYDVKPGDNLWTVAGDVAKIQGFENPTEQQIYDVVNQMSHVGVNGDANKINAGDTITFGKGAGVANDQINFSVPGNNSELNYKPQGLDVNGDQFKFHGTDLKNVPKEPQFTPGADGSFSYTDTNNHQVTVYPPAQGHEVPVVKTDLGNGHIEYRQGTRSIWNSGDGQWWAGSDGRNASKVAAPWEPGLARGEIRSADIDGSEFILGGSPTNSNQDGWQGH